MALRRSTMQLRTPSPACRRIRVTFTSSKPCIGGSSLLAGHCASAGASGGAVGRDTNHSGPIESHLKACVFLLTTLFANFTFNRSMGRKTLRMMKKKRKKKRKKREKRKERKKKEKKDQMKICCFFAPKVRCRPCNPTSKRTNSQCYTHRHATSTHSTPSPHTQRGLRGCSIHGGASGAAGGQGRDTLALGGEFSSYTRIIPCYILQLVLERADLEVEALAVGRGDVLDRPRLGGVF